MKQKHTLANAPYYHTYYITQIINPNLDVELTAETLKIGTLIKIHSRARTRVEFYYWDKQGNEHLGMLHKNTASHFILNA